MLANAWDSFKDAAAAITVVAGVIAAIAIIWAKLVKPAASSVRRLVRAIDRMDAAMDYVEKEMKNDSGKSVKDLIEKTDRAMTSTEHRLTSIEATLLNHDSHFDRLGTQINSAVQASAAAAGTLALHTQEEMRRYGTIVSMFLSLADHDSAEVKALIEEMKTQPLPQGVDRVD